MEDIGSPEEEFHVPRDSFSSFQSAQSEPARSEKGSKAGSGLGDPTDVGEDKSQKDFNRKSSLNSRISEEAKSEGRVGFRKLWQKFASGSFEAAKKTVVKEKHSQDVSDKKEIQEPKMVPYWKLYRYADSLDYLLIFLGFLGSIAHGAVSPVNMYFFGRIINSFGAHQNDPSYAASQVSRLALILFIIAVNSLWVTWIEVACWMQTGERQACRLRSKYVEAILRQEIGFFDTSTTTGDVVSSISTDTLMFQEAIGEKVGMYLHSMGTFAAGITVAFIACWKLALLTLVSLPLLLLTGVIYGSIYSTLMRRSHIKQLAAVSVIEQAAAQIRTVYAYVGEARAVASFLRIAQESTRAGTLAGLVKGLGLGASLGIINLSWALGIWYGSSLVTKGDVDGGHVVTTLFCILFAGMALGQATPELQVFSRGRLAASRIYKVLKRIPKISSGPAGRQVMANVKGEVQFDNVVFSYPSRPEALIFNGLSFTVKAGEHVALVGGSGSGKSTVLALIERFYDPTSGQVKVDGKNIQALQLRWLRSRIGLVGQEPALFATSIYENILFGNPHATRQTVEAAARAAHAHTFIKALPSGYDTFVGEKGVQLSGGQKQRIAVARAVLKNPSILLLDEATSALDAESETAVQDGLDMLMLNRTTITVAHRFSTIQNADSIMVFRYGKIVESGTHKDLLRRGRDGLYYSLVHLQEKALEVASLDKSAAAGTSLPVSQRELVGTLRLSPDTTGTNPNSTPWGSGSVSQYGTPAPSLGIPSPITSTMTVPKSLKLSPGGGSPSRRSNSSMFVTPLGSESSEPNHEGRKPSAKSHQVVTGDETDHSVFTASLLCEVVRSVLPEGLSVITGGTGAVIVGALNPLFAYLMIRAIASFYGTSRRGTAKQADEMSLAIMCLGIAAIVGNALQHYHFGRAGEIISQRLKQKTFEGVLRNEVAWFDREENASSMLTARVSSNALLVRNAVTDRLPCFVQCLTAVAVALTISFILEWRMALVCVGTFPLVMAGGSIKQGFQKTGFAGNLQLSFERASAVAGEAVRNIRTVASFGAEDKMLTLFNSQLVQHKKTIFVQSQKGGFLFGVSQCAMFSANALAMWYASVLVKQGQATFAAVLQTFQVLAWTGYFLAEGLSLVPDLAKGYTAAASMFKAIHRVSSIEPDTADGKILETVQGRIDLVKVTFHFPSRPDVTVLRDLNLHIAAGSTHALVGSSGSGKSTILSLVLRFYDPFGGEVLIDGVNITTLNLRRVRQQIGLVQQEPVLFRGTIRMNILYGNDKASEAEVVAAARLANAYGFISSLPKGFDTEVGEQGVQLSGGQKQRVAIARAALKNPLIMLLDEPTSALDTQSEKIVQEALNNIMQGNRTTIVIAHRLSLVRQADKITVMDHGKVLEEGTHDTLASAGGLYSRLCNLQRVAK